MTLPARAASLFRNTFGAEPAILTLAPGRIEFIGNHTDYNAGTVLGAAIDRGVCVAARSQSGGILRSVSDHGPAVVTVPIVSPERQSGPAAWTNYLLGVLIALEKRGMTKGDGVEVAVVSELPVGAGLSSSAAIELAAGMAFSVLRGFDPPLIELVQACREAENDFVGVPCGILDQGVSGFGRRDHLVHIDCRGPAFSTIPLPAGVHFWIFNTHTKHALVDSLYATRHRECMDAARHLGVPWLADATPEQVSGARARLPEAAGRRAQHVVEEIARVAAMGDLLAHADLATAGQLLFASHESSRRLFENSTPELDFLVDALRGRRGVLGARLTGGGFGGAVMALTTSDFDSEGARAVSAAYAARFGSDPDHLCCATADGARVL